MNKRLQAIEERVNNAATGVGKERVTALRVLKSHAESDLTYLLILQKRAEEESGKGGRGHE